MSAIAPALRFVFDGTQFASWPGCRWADHGLELKLDRGEGQSPKKLALKR